MSTLKLLFVFLFLGGGAQAEGKERDGRQDTNVNSAVDALTAGLSLLEANEEANRQETLSLKRQLQQVNGQLQQVKGDNRHLSQQIQQIKGDNLHLSQQLQPVKEDNRHLSQQLQQLKGDNLHLSQQLRQVKGDNRRQTHLLNQYSAHMGNFTQHLHSVDYELDQYRSKLTHRSTIRTRRGKRPPMTPRISFSALLWNTTRYQPFEVIKFNYICYTWGGAYDPFTGFFTATMDGVYHFVVTLATGPTGPTGDVMLVSDAHCFLKIYKTNTEFRVWGTAHNVIRLLSWRRVWVKNFGFNQNLWEHSMFSGFLVHTW